MIKFNNIGNCKVTVFQIVSNAAEAFFLFLSERLVYYTTKCPTQYSIGRVVWRPVATILCYVDKLLYKHRMDEMFSYCDTGILYTLVQNLKLSNCPLTK